MVGNYAPKADEHVKRVVRELPSGNLCWVQAYQATHAFMGWASEFKTHVQHRSEQGRVGWVQHTAKDSNRRSNGIGMMIWRSSDRHRPGPGGRHRFRVSMNFTLFDTAKLAYFTDADWHYMTTPSGEVRTREELRDMYETWLRAGRR